MITDLEYLQEAYRVAVAHSGDPRTQTGSLIVPARGFEPICRSANGLPRGIPEREEFWSPEAKKSYAVHSERRAIFAAARDGVAIDGMILYSTWGICDQSAQAVIEAGISEVVSHWLPHHDLHSGWISSLKIAKQMLKEAGIPLKQLSGSVNTRFLFNGFYVEA